VFLHRTFFNGLFDHLISLFCDSVTVLRAADDPSQSTIFSGNDVYSLIQVISFYLDDSARLRYFLHRKKDQALSLISAYFALRGLVFRRSKLIADAASLIKKVMIAMLRSTFDFLEVPNILGPRIVLEGSVSAIRLAPSAVIQEVLTIIYPPHAIVSVPVIIRIVPGQENFIPGRFSRDSIPSETIGRNFGDIKNKICRDTGIDPAIGIELLVGGNIIAHAMPIDEVYRRVWQPANGNSPMVVLLRLSGVFGEATERIISQFPRAAADEVSPEVRFEFTTVLCDSGGFRALLDVLNGSLPSNSLDQLVRLLPAFCSVRRNRDALNSSDAVGRIFTAIPFLMSRPSALADAVTAAADLLRDGPIILAPDAKIAFVLEALELPIVRQNEATLLAPLVRLIPPLATGAPHLLRSVLNFFFSKIGADGNENVFARHPPLFLLHEFAQFVLALPAGSELRDLIIRERIIGDAIEVLRNLKPGTADAQSSLPELLDTLAGMARGHSPTQELLASDDAFLLKLLLDLEGEPSERSFGAHAAAVLSAAEAEPSICADILTSLRRKRAEATRARAEAERARAVAAADAPLPQGLLDILAGLSEARWECCVCKEGYEYLPGQILGVYVFTNRVPSGIHTATYFVCIHQQCHEASLPPRRQGEWEAARVRNSEKPCNHIFPLPHLSVTRHSYRATIAMYFENLGFGTDPFAAVVGDVRTHCAMLAEGNRIPVSAGGGSLSSIMSLIPFLIYAGHILLGDARPRGTNAEDIAVRSLWFANAVEWKGMRAEVFAGILKGRVVGEEWNSGTKQSFLFFVIVDRIQRMLKNEGDDWPADFLVRVEKDGPEIAQEFADFADIAEEEIFPVANLGDAWVLAEFEEGDPEEFIRSALKQ
jgi:E3 ubiquitin-protein ligase UBR4